MRDRAEAAYDGRARGRAGDLHRRNMRRLDDLTVQGLDGLRRSRTQVERFVEDNPLLVGVVGVAAGLLLGALLPRTRQEDRSLGPYADEVRGEGLRYAREMTHRGREFVQSALDPDNLNEAVRKATGADDETPPAGSGRSTTSDADVSRHCERQRSDPEQLAAFERSESLDSSAPLAMMVRESGRPEQSLVLLAQHVLLHLAHGVARQFVHEQHALGAFELGTGLPDRPRWRPRRGVLAATTTAVTASPKSAWGRPITADSTTPGRASISVSTSFG